MKLQYLILLTVLQVIYVNCQEVLVVGSHYVPNSSEYSVFLHTSQMKKNSIVNMSLIAPEYGISKTINIFDENLMQKVDFELSENLYPEYDLQVMYKNFDDNTCKKQSIKLITMSRRPVILIQLNRAVYKAGDDIKFRVFVLTPKLTPHDQINELEVNILDSNSNIQRKFNKFKKSQYGVYEGSLMVPNDPELGHWKIEVNVDGKKRTKIFEVQKVDINSLEVDIDTRKEIPLENKKIYLSLKVKNPIENFFLGVATITASGTYRKNGNNQPISYNKAKNISSTTLTFDFDIKEDLKIVSPESEVVVSFKVQIHSIDHKMKFDHNLEVRLKKSKENRNLKLIKNKYFRPGIKYPIKIEIKSFGKSLDNFMDLIDIHLKFFNKNTTSSKKHRIKLKKSVLITNITPPKDTDMIEIYIKYNEDSLTETILAVPTHCKDEYMQVGFLSHGEGIGSSSKFRVETTAKFTTLYTIVINSNGVLQNKEYPEAIDNKTFDFTLELTSIMAPRSNLIIYYIRQDGVVIYDYVPLVFDASIDSSSLKLTTLSSAKMGKQININMEAPQDSKIFLLASDQSSSQANEIFERDIIDEIFSYRHLKFDEQMPLYLEKLGTFAIQPLKGMHCNEIEDSKVLSYTDKAEEIKFSTMDTTKNYFANIWFDDSIYANTNEQVLSKQTPMTSSTFKLSAIAMHPISGLSITQIPKEVSIYDEIIVKVNAPPEVTLGEIFSVEYEVINLQSGPFYVDVSINIENGFVMESKQKYANKTIYVGKCLDFNAKSQSIKNEIRLDVNGIPRKENFFIQSTNAGSMKINIKVMTYNLEVNAHETIKVNDPQMKVNEKIDSYWLNEHILVDKRTLVSGINFMLSNGNLLGPLINDSQSIFDFQADSYEQKISKLASSVIVYQLLSGYNLTQTDNAENELNNIWTYYQEVLSVVRTIKNSNDKKNVKLATFVAQVLADTKTVIDIGEKAINDLLEFVEESRRSNGDIDVTANDGLRNEIASEKAKSNILVALSYLAFSCGSSYQTNVYTSIGNLKKRLSSFETDYERAITAYVFALNGDNSHSQDLLNQISSLLLSTNDKEYLAMNVEVVSYVILAKLKLKQNPKNEMKWLIKNRSINGRFYSDFDTVLGLRALYEYSKFKNFINPHTGIKINDRKTKTLESPFDKIEDEVHKLLNKIELSGNGVAYSTITNKISPNLIVQSNYFGFKHSIEHHQQDLYLGLQFVLGEDNICNSKLLVVDIELPRGYKYVNHDFSNYIQKVDTANNGHKVIVYISNMEKHNAYSFKIQSRKTHQFYNLQTSLIKIYEYDRPNLEYKHYYSFDVNFETCRQDRQIHEEQTKKLKEIERKRLEEERRILLKIKAEKMEKDRQAKRDKDAADEMFRMNKKEEERCNTGFWSWLKRCNFVESFQKYEKKVRFFKRDGSCDKDI